MDFLALVGGQSGRWPYPQWPDPWWSKHRQYRSWGIIRERGRECRKGRHYLAIRLPSPLMFSTWALWGGRSLIITREGSIAPPIRGGPDSTTPPPLISTPLVIINKRPLISSRVLYYIFILLLAMWCVAHGSSRKVNKGYFAYARHLAHAGQGWSQCKDGTA